MGLQRALLGAAGGQRSQPGMELVIDDVRESEIQHRDISFGVPRLVDRVRLDLGGYSGIRRAGRQIPQVPGAFAFPLRTRMSEVTIQPGSGNRRPWGRRRP